jgi:maleate isomerase
MSWEVGVMIPPPSSFTEVDFYMTWRVGLLIPSPNSVMEVDFYRSLPHDTTLHTARMYMPDTSAASEEQMLDQFTLPAATMVGTVMPHIVVFGSTSASLLRGKDYDREICERVGELTGAEPISVAESVNQALRDTRATRVAVVTPYTDDMNWRIKTSIESQGIAVSAMHGMGLSPAKSATVTPESIYSFVQSRIGTRVPGDALFIASTDYHAMSALSLLKIAYDVPIVTTNLAALQAVKRKLHGLREREMAPATTRRPATT